MLLGKAAEQDRADLWVQCPTPCPVPWLAAEGSSVADLCLVSASPWSVTQREWRKVHHHCPLLTNSSLTPGYDIFQRDPLNNVVSAQPKLESAAAMEPTLRQGCFYLLVFVPITCALLQLLSWSQFSLHGKRLQMVKAQRQSLTQGRAPEVKTI